MQEREGNQSEAELFCPNGTTADGQCLEPATKTGLEDLPKDLEDDIPPPAAQGWDPDDADIDYHEPLQDVTTEVPADDWMGSRERSETSGPTTRQEDTELGIFREDDS